MNPNTDAASAVSAVTAHIETIESELAATRAALAEMEASFAAGPPSEQPDALTIEQVGKALGVGRTTVTEMIKRGDIKSVKIGALRRVFRADLDAYIESMRASA